MPKEKQNESTSQGGKGSLEAKDLTANAEALKKNQLKLKIVSLVIVIIIIVLVLFSL